MSAAVAAGRVESLTIEKRRAGRSEVKDLIDQVGQSNVRYIEDARSSAETESPQGVLADCRPILPVGLDSLADESAAVLVLDHLEDPQNVGAIARSAAAAGATGMVVSSRRAAPLSAAAFKAAAGALENLPVAVVGSIPEALRRLKAVGLWTVGLASEGSESLFGLGLLTEPVAIVVGAEGEGLSPLVARRCDLIASIPMQDGTESLNASVSAALAVFEIMRARS